MIFCDSRPQPQRNQEGPNDSHGTDLWASATFRDAVGFLASSSIAISLIFFRLVADATLDEAKMR